MTELTAGDLLAAWEERDARYRKPGGTVLTPDLEAGVLQNRMWEAMNVKGRTERNKVLAALKQWVPPRRWEYGS